MHCEASKVKIETASQAAFVAFALRSKDAKDAINRSASKFSLFAIYEPNDYRSYDVDPSFNSFACRKDK